MWMIVWVVGGVGAVTGSVIAALYRLTVKAQRPRQLPNDAVPSVPFESVEWKSSGKAIKGWLLPRASMLSDDTQTSPVIIIAHGWGSNRSRVLRYVLPLYKEGYSILMYDARSHGDSEYYRTPTGLQFRDDLLATIEWLHLRSEVDMERIGVLGHSLGAFGAVLALDADAPIAALVTDSMPVRFSTMIGAELKRRRLPQFPLALFIQQLMAWNSRIPRATMRRANPAAILADNAKGRQVPVLLVHSRRDDFIPPDELQFILSDTPEVPHLFVDVEGHSASEQDPDFWPTVISFFSAQLQKK